MVSASGLKNRPRRKRRSHEGQKRRLVHARQRARATRSPHSQQKFGLYIVCIPLPLRTRGVCVVVVGVKEEGGRRITRTRVSNTRPRRRALYARAARTQNIFLRSDARAPFCSNAKPLSVMI